MKVAPVIALMSAVALAGACRGPAPPAPGGWTARFGPVVGEEAVVGRVVMGRTVWLLTAEPALVRVDVDARRHERFAIGPREPGEDVWGLGMSRDPGLWTLLGRESLAQLAPDGRIVRRLPLTEPHANVFSGPGELLYQVHHFAPPSQALLAGPPGDAARRPWGTMTTRHLPLPRAQTALMNMVSCGPPAPGGIPCWFPDLPLVTITSANDRSRDVRLDGVRAAEPQVLLAADRPKRPILDTHLSGSDALWVLGSGEAPEGAHPDARGGWLLARYSIDGRVLERMTLPEPARMLLGVTDASCLVLSWNGLVVEVRP